MWSAAHANARGVLCEYGAPYRFLNDLIVAAAIRVRFVICIEYICAVAHMHEAPAFRNKNMLMDSNMHEASVDKRL